MSMCVLCGKAATVHLTGEDGAAQSYCAGCYSATTAGLLGMDMPVVPETVILEDCEGRSHTFYIEFLFHPHCKELTARESHEDGYVCTVAGTPEENFSFLWSRLNYRLSKLLSVKYMEHGRMKGDKAAGYVGYDSVKDTHYLVIDGKRCEWSEMGKQLAMFEGFQIKIEFADPSDDPL